GRAAFAAAVPAGARRLFAWHVLPIALSFLVPKRLAAFLWFVGPTNLPLGADAGLAAGARAYAIWFAEGYHAAPWMAALVVVLAGVGLMLRRRLAPGHEAVFALALAGALLTILHPQRQPRFIHSWVAAWWIAAALGLGALLAAAPLRAAARRAVAAALVCVLVVAQAEPLRRGAAAARLAENPAGRSDLDITDSYVGAIGGYRNVGVLSTVAAGALLQWTYYDRHRRRRGIESFRVPMVRGPEDVRNAARFWLATTAADALVLIDSRRPEHAIASLGWTPDNLSAAVEEVERQTRFRRIASWRPEAGGLVTVSLWEAVPR
ncbi:MAG: hypothetical protein JNL66_25295, partial [Alphaproteobacteria bacterium]|nr:hypothetical protein [Alphaproteobacteria bacterium]